MVKKLKSVEEQVFDNNHLTRILSGLNEIKHLKDPNTSLSFTLIGAQQIVNFFLPLFSWFWDFWESPMKWMGFKQNLNPPKLCCLCAFPQRFEEMISHQIAWPPGTLRSSASQITKPYFPANKSTTTKSLLCFCDER